MLEESDLVIRMKIGRMRWTGSANGREERGLREPVERKPRGGTRLRRKQRMRWVDEQKNELIR